LYVGGSLISVPNVLCYYLSTNTANTGNAVVKFDTQYNTNNNTLLSYSSSTGVFTNSASFSIVVAVSFMVAFDTNSSGQRGAWIIDNNSKVYAQSFINAVSGNFTECTGCGIIYLSSGGTFYINAYQNSGGNLNLFGGVGQNGTNVQVVAF
jgi:hypothetical protein